MKKSEVVTQIAKQTGLHQPEIKLVLEVFFQTVQEEVARGEKVHFRNFGCFWAKERKQKIGRNISQNTAMVIPAHYVPSFSPAQSFLDKVKDELSITTQGGGQ